MASGSLLPSWTDLLLRLTKKAATRQTIAATMAAMTNRTASTTKTMAMIVLPDDLPAALVELTSSSLKDVRRRGRLRWQPRIGVGSFDGTGAGHDPPAAAPAPLIRDDCRTLLRKGTLGCAVVNAPWQIYRLPFLRVRRKSRTTNSPSRSGCALSTRPPFRRATSLTKAVKRSSSTSMKMFKGAFRRVILSTSARVSSSVSGAGGQSNQ